MIKHTQRICQQIADNCLSVFDHFVGLALKGLTWYGKCVITSKTRRIANADPSRAMSQRM